MHGPWHISIDSQIDLQQAIYFRASEKQETCQN